MFLRLEEVKKADAENLTAAISSAIETGFKTSTVEWKSKLVGLATDGAAVMTGKKTGVVTRLSTDLPHVVPIHCMAHRLELCYKDAGTKITCHVKLERLLLNLYYFYHNSPLNRANLKASFQLLNLSVLLPTRVGGTRWVGHILKALQHFLQGYPAIVQHLEQV